MQTAICLLLVVFFLLMNAFFVIAEFALVRVRKSQIDMAVAEKRRGAEAAIASLAVFADICTANNTVAIISVGTISRNIAHRFGIPPRRAASLLDTFSCFVQGIIPYGAQLLMAAGLASVSPVQIIPHLYYPFIMGCCAVLAIILQRPRYRD